MMRRYPRPHDITGHPPLATLMRAGCLAAGLAGFALADWPLFQPVQPTQKARRANEQPTGQPAAQPAAEKKPPRDGRCDRCGSCRDVRSVCLPVEVEREKVKICWSYEREEICIPGPSKYCGKTCERDECGCWWREIWKPTCARVIPKHVPVRREVVRKLPGIEWQTRERCCRCRKLPEPPLKPPSDGTPPAAGDRSPAAAAN